MPRNMSFMLTTDQVRNKTKTVTRRTGWSFLKSGDIVNAVEKGMGLKKGEKVKRICQIRIKSIYSEALFRITKEECIKEGFPEMLPDDFIDMFCHHNKVWAMCPV
ncbi:MAG: hypothetical protein L6263_11055 [Desulfobacteraceae bacterium]|nr:hypothetical protein [Desulfobacteraceae bacterium]